MITSIEQLKVILNALNLDHHVRNRGMTPTLVIFPNSDTTLAQMSALNTLISNTLVPILWKNDKQITLPLS